jgi:hypothetical protein
MNATTTGITTTTTISHALHLREKQTRRDFIRAYERGEGPDYLGSIVISCARFFSTAAGENGNVKVDPPYHAAH